MTLESLLERLRALGGTVRAENGQLRCLAPQGVLTPHLLEHVKALKPEVIRCLTSEPSHTAAVAIDQSIRHATNWQHLSQVWEDIYAAYRAGDIDLDVADQFTSLIRSRAREMPESDDGVLLEMPLGEVAVSGLCREIHSKVLDERVLRAADNAELPADTPLAVYRASELQLLDGARWWRTDRTTIWSPQSPCGTLSAMPVDRPLGGARIAASAFAAYATHNGGANVPRSCARWEAIPTVQYLIQHGRITGPN